MPYIKSNRRNELKETFKPETAGEFNYCICQMAINFLGSHPTYDNYNETIGAIECAKAEIIRKSLSPYEDKKINENGDLVWPLINL